MSGIYIAGMEMPQRDEVVTVFPDGTAHRHHLGLKLHLSEGNAVPVPNHGDLIDRVAFREEMDKHYPFDRYTQSKHKWEDAAKSAVIRMLATAPTIIPADKAGG